MDRISQIKQLKIYFLIFRDKIDLLSYNMQVHNIFSYRVLHGFIRS